MDAGSDISGCLYWLGLPAGELPGSPNQLLPFQTLRLYAGAPPACESELVDMSTVDKPDARL